MVFANNPIIVTVTLDTQETIVSFQFVTENYRMTQIMFVVVKDDALVQTPVSGTVDIMEMSAKSQLVLESVTQTHKCAPNTDIATNLINATALMVGFQEIVVSLLVMEFGQQILLFALDMVFVLKLMFVIVFRVELERIVN